MTITKVPYTLTKQFYNYYSKKIPMVCEKCGNPLKIGDRVMPRYSHKRTRGGGNVLYCEECARELNIIV